MSIIKSLGESVRARLKKSGGSREGAARSKKV